MTPIHKPAEEQVLAMLEEATSGGKITAKEWLKTFLASLKSFLLANPRRYRCYGPFWWLVKSALVDTGETGFGTGVDLETFEAIDYGDTVKNVLAAFIYHEAAFDQGLMVSHDHQISYPDGEVADYRIIDEEMEQLALTLIR